MAKKIKTFADESKEIRQKYYKDREPGEDKITDDSFNAEMKSLMQAQEAVKPKEDPQKNPQFANQEFKNGGGLSQYSGLERYSSFLNPNPTTNLGVNTDYSNFGQNAMYNPNQFSSQGFQANITPDLNLNSSQAQINPQSGMSDFQPTSNILGPALSIGANAISSHILAKNAKRRKAGLLNDIDVNLGRVSAQQIDLGRERANIRSNQALTEAGGRYAARNATSASEAARITNAARLGSQRVSGKQLSQSLQREELENARLRSEAQRTNQQLSAQEGLQEQQQRMMIEQMYGDAPTQLGAQFAQTTGQTIQNYLAENQRMRRDYDYLQMSQPNMTMQYDVPEDKRWLYNLGIKQPSRNITVRS